MQARDRAEVEGSRLHERASALEGSLTQKDAEFRAEQSAAEVLRQRLTSLQEETDALRREAEVAAQVPQLRLDLRETQAALQREREAHSSASVRASSCSSSCMSLLPKPRTAEQSV